MDSTTAWPPKEAIQRFLDAYSDLDDPVAVRIINALNDHGKARTFLLLKPGSFRDMWLFKLLPVSLQVKDLELGGKGAVFI